MPSDLLKNGIAFLQKRYPHAPVSNRDIQVSIFPEGNSFTMWPMIAQDPATGVKQRAIAVHDLGLQQDAVVAVASEAVRLLDELDTGIFIDMDNVFSRKGHPINTTQMSFAPKILIYTNAVHTSHDDILSAFSAAGLLIEIINESEMYQSLFISYGGPDEPAAVAINAYLKSKGIKTWFFPEDALPGEKLHRMMHEGINRHDRVLLICSQHSLTRPGVLNEIERVLEREAREGGAEILIPISLDDYVYGEWAPGKPDIAEQIRSRVITKIDFAPDYEQQRSAAFGKLVAALSRLT